MPVNPKMMNALKREYGPKSGERAYYAIEMKQKKKKKRKRNALA